MFVFIHFKRYIMKRTIFLMTLLLCFTLGNAQNTSSTSQVAPNSGQSAIETLLTSKNFEFVANTVLPLGQPPKNLVGSDYSVTFSPEMIVSNMPYYGRAYRTLMGRDKGMRFKGAPENFTVAAEDNNYKAHATVEDENDSYSILLTVEHSGIATLTISSNGRESIEYHGEVVSVKN
jgi:hypothetical protein